MARGEASRATRSVALAVILAVIPAVSLAAPRALAAQEFVRQSLLIAPLRPDSAGSGARDAVRTAKQVTDAVRERTGQRTDVKSLRVLEGYRLDNLLLELNYKPQQRIGDAELRFFGQQLRADEVLVGRVVPQPAGVTVVARLALLRSWGMQQPLPVVRAATPALAGDALAREVVSARAQLTGVRRCENALARGDRRAAAREAEGAIRAYAPAVIARDCLIAALIDGTTSADSVRRLTDDVLAIDSTNLFAAVVRADALETEGRTADAVAQWRRVYALRNDSLALGVRVVEGFLRLQRPADALTDATDLLTRLGADARLRRLVFRAHAALAHWRETAALGDSLELEDAAFRADSNYATRYVEALRQQGDTLAALEVGVRAVRRHAGDARLYLQYLQLLGMETSSALPRGLTRFPEVPDFYVLTASAARKAGNRTDALRATQEAIRRDTSRTTLYLQLADLFVEAQRADSAAAVLARAPRTGEQAELLRTYTVARGLLLLRAAGDTLPVQQQAAVSMLWLADSISSRADSRAYAAAATLQLARAQLLQASKTRACPDARTADATLGQSAAAIERGLGESANATEITSMQAAMRSAVDNAMTVLCRP